MNPSPLAQDVRIPLIRFMLATFLMMASAVLFVGVQFLSVRHGILASLALVADIPALNQTLLASVFSVAALVFVVLSGRAWWAFERWLASTRLRAGA